LINPIKSDSPWSRRTLDLLIFGNKFSLNKNWILFILFLNRKLTIAWKENCFTLICFFCFKSSSLTQLDFLGPSSSFKKQGKILTSSSAASWLATWLPPCVTAGMISNDTHAFWDGEVESLPICCDILFVILLSTYWKPLGFIIKALPNVTSLLKINLLSFRFQIL